VKHCVLAAALFPLTLTWAASAQPLPPAPPGAQITTRFGIEFGVVGSPNNIPYRDEDLASRPAHLPGSQFNGQGSIPYTYALARTETTAAQWVPFLNAFRPHWTGDPIFPSLTGGIVSYDSQTGFSTVPGYENTAVAPSFPFIAAYCNWLHNNQALTRDAFLSGSYDLRGLDLARPQTWTQPVAAMPGATYRLPTWSEWNKGMYYDPNRFGSGQGGWWLFPMRQDTPPISELPGTPGAQTLAGGSVIPPGPAPFPVGSFPMSQSAFGLLDGSGGVFEALEGTEFVPGFNQLFLYHTGTEDYGSDILYLSDQIGWTLAGRPIQFGFGFRVAQVPTPSTGIVLASIFFVNKRRRV